jgi:hypothetical protein
MVSIIVISSSRAISRIRIVLDIRWKLQGVDSPCVKIVYGDHIRQVLCTEIEHLNGKLPPEGSVWNSMLDSSWPMHASSLMTIRLWNTCVAEYWNPYCSWWSQGYARNLLCQKRPLTLSNVVVVNGHDKERMACCEVTLSNGRNHIRVLKLVMVIRCLWGSSANVSQRNRNGAIIL